MYFASAIVYGNGFIFTGNDDEPYRHGTTISKIKAATNRIAGRPVGLGRPQSIAFGDGALWVPSGSYLSALRGLADAIGADPAIKPGSCSRRPG